MTKITTIGITSPCGGNGCTTLAVHLAWFAAQRRGIRTLAVSMDRTGALVRHFLPDMGLRVDSFGRISEALNACYFDVEATVSKLLPTLGLSKDEYPSLIVVDLGCGMSSDLLTDVDLWLTPVADVRTMRALLDTGYPRSGQGKTYIAFNRSGGSQYAKRLLAQAGDSCSDLSALRAEIPHSGAVQRASLHYETVWQHSPESRAAANLKTWA
jgi:CO dehydrogenase nickel-insertion accessory protein CooC1